MRATYMVLEGSASKTRSATLSSPLVPVSVPVTSGCTLLLRGASSMLKFMKAVTRVSTCCCVFACCMRSSPPALEHTAAYCGDGVLRDVMWLD